MPAHSCKRYHSSIWRHRLSLDDPYLGSHPPEYVCVTLLKQSILIVQ